MFEFRRAPTAHAPTKSSWKRRRGLGTEPGGPLVVKPIPRRSLQATCGKYAEPWASALVELKHESRRREMNQGAALHRGGGRGTMTVSRSTSRTTPERLWEAITNGELRRKYSFGVETVSD